MNRMSEYPEALLAKVSAAIEEFPNNSWSAADAALDALGMRPAHAVQVTPEGRVYDVIRYVTEWEHDE